MYFYRLDHQDTIPDRHKNISCSLCVQTSSQSPIRCVPGERTRGIPRWASELVWTQRLKEKCFVPAGDQTPVVQSVVKHHTGQDVGTPITLIQ
jgi:hypothetical protein